MNIGSINLNLVPSGAHQHIGQTENKSGDLAENSKTSDRTTAGCNVWIHRPAGDYGSTFKRGVLYIAIGY